MESVTMSTMESGARGALRAPELASWALAHGRHAFTTSDLAGLLGVPTAQVRQRLQAPRERGEWVTPARGLWVPVPPEYRLWGAPPAIDFIAALMDHLGVGYYVGWLSAASLYGAAHQAPQVFQVATSAPVRDRSVGRNVMQFSTRTHVGSVPTRLHTAATGTVTVSSVATTMLDVAADATLAGGISNAATVIVELAEHDDFRVDDLVPLVEEYPAAASRRVGWILERFAERSDLEALHEAVDELNAAPSRANPVFAASGPVDRRWMIHLNDDAIEVEA